MLKKIIVLMLAPLVLCSCVIRIGGAQIEKDIREYETDYSSVKTETARVTGLKDEAFEESFNSAVADDIESALIAFDTTAAESADNVRMGNKCVFQTSWEEKYNDNDFISLVEERYIYTGGAHGETAWLPRNIDIAASKEIRLGDLFEDDDYPDTLNRMIDEIIAENTEEYSDLWEKPVIGESHQTDFYIEDGKLVIFFRPYALSYYARGFVEFHIPLGELSGYLKEEYRRLI